MRKYLIAALAAVLSIAVASVALAQNAASRRHREASPDEGGHQVEAEELDPQAVRQEQPDRRRRSTPSPSSSPRTLKLSGKGFKYCSADDAQHQGRPRCPAGSKAGSGTAHAVLGPAPRAAPASPLTPTSAARTTIIFYTQQDAPGTIRKGLVGKVSKASGKYGSKIVITIAEDLQQPAPGLFSALVDLQTTLKARRASTTWSLDRLQEEEAQVRRASSATCRTRRPRPPAPPRARRRRSARSSSLTALLTQPRRPRSAGPSSFLDSARVLPPVFATASSAAPTCRSPRRCSAPPRRPCSCSRSWRSRARGRRRGCKRCPSGGCSASRVALDVVLGLARRLRLRRRPSTRAWPGTDAEQRQPRADRGLRRASGSACRSPRCCSATSGGCSARGARSGAASAGWRGARRRRRDARAAAVPGARRPLAGGGGIFGFAVCELCWAARPRARDARDHHARLPRRRCSSG